MVLASLPEICQNDAQMKDVGSGASAIPTYYPGPLRSAQLNCWRRQAPDPPVSGCLNFGGGLYGARTCGRALALE